jgi:hypothetical protein
MASVDLGVDEVCLNDLVGFGLFGEQAVSSSSVRVSSSGFRFMVFSFVSYCRDTPCGYPLYLNVLMF